MKTFSVVGSATGLLIDFFVLAVIPLLFDTLVGVVATVISPLTNGGLQLCFLDEYGLIECGDLMLFIIMALCFFRLLLVMIEALFVSVLEPLCPGS